MSAFPESDRRFKGRDDVPGRAWWRGEDDRVDYVDPDQRAEPLPPGHPGAYEASDELIDAVNTALLLRRPLLVTGKPGTGKTELAERIAYELDLGAALRFDAQSLSEANDLFYRFDHIGYLFATKRYEREGLQPGAFSALDFVHWGPLGRAVLRSNPSMEHRLRDEAMHHAGVIAPVAGAPAVEAPRQSVVLIDEIDKASRDFPNDLLNGIDRMEFRVRELGLRTVRGAGRESPHHPIVVVTSNSERDLPQPFLRRCIFVSIPDPDQEMLRRIVRNRVFAHLPASADLPALYEYLLEAFVELRDDTDLNYPIGTAELLDMATAAREGGVDPNSVDEANRNKLARLVSSVAKHPDDREPVVGRLRAGP